MASWAPDDQQHREWWTRLVRSFRWRFLGEGRRYYDEAGR